AECLAPALHVGEIEVGHDVRQQRQEPIAHHMPEVDDAVDFGAAESRPEHGIGFSGEYRSQQFGVLTGRVLQIGILNQHDVARGGSYGGAQSRSFAGVRLAPVDIDLVGQGLTANRIGAIGGAVVHYDDFEVYTLDPNGAHGLHDLGDRASFVLGGYEYRDLDRRVAHGRGPYCEFLATSRANRSFHRPV